jgi:hypothetical protein
MNGDGGMNGDGEMREERADLQAALFRGADCGRGRGWIVSLSSRAQQRVNRGPSWRNSAAVTTSSDRRVVSTNESFLQANKQPTPSQHNASQPHFHVLSIQCGGIDVLDTVCYHHTTASYRACPSTHTETIAGPPPCIYTCWRSRLTPFSTRSEPFTWTSTRLATSSTCL